MCESQQIFMKIMKQNNYISFAYLHWQFAITQGSASVHFLASESGRSTSAFL